MSDQTLTEAIFIQYIKTTNKSSLSKKFHTQGSRDGFSQASFSGYISVANPQKASPKVINKIVDSLTEKEKDMIITTLQANANLQNQNVVKQPSKKYKNLTYKLYLFCPDNKYNIEIGTLKIENDFDSIKASIESEIDKDGYKYLGTVSASKSGSHLIFQLKLIDEDNVKSKDFHFIVKVPTGSPQELAFGCFWYITHDDHIVAGTIIMEKNDGKQGEIHQNIVKYFQYRYNNFIKIPQTELPRNIKGLTKYFESQSRKRKESNYKKNIQFELFLIGKQIIRKIKDKAIQKKLLIQDSELVRSVFKEYRAYITSELKVKEIETVATLVNSNSHLLIKANEEEILMQIQ